MLGGENQLFRPCFLRELQGFLFGVPKNRSKPYLYNNQHFNTNNIMKARNAFEHMERAFGPIVSILMLIDLGKDLFEYAKEKVQNRKARTSQLNPAGAR